MAKRKNATQGYPAGFKSPLNYGGSRKKGETWDPPQNVMPKSPPDPLGIVPNVNKAIRLNDK